MTEQPPAQPEKGTDLLYPDVLLLRMLNSVSDGADLLHGSHVKCVGMLNRLRNARLERREMTPSPSYTDYCKPPPHMSDT